jgi:quinol monooxygenase YgiN
MPLGTGKEPVAILVEVTAKEGKYEELKAALQTHATTCLKEEVGCTRFEVLVPVTREGAREEGVGGRKLWLTEQYADEEAVAVHQGTERMAVLGKKLEELIDDIRIVYGLQA